MIGFLGAAAMELAMQRPNKHAKRNEEEEEEDGEAILTRKKEKGS